MDRYDIDYVLFPAREPTSRMILRSLELRDFRGFNHTRIDFDPRLTVLVGTNGSGKSSVLDALALMLDQYASRLLDMRSSAKRMSAMDARHGSPDTYLRLTVQDGGREVRWALRKQGRKQRVLRPIGSELSSLNEFVRSTANRGVGEEDFLRSATLPIYYDQRRGLAEVPQRKRAAAKHSAKDAFADSRGKGGVDFRGFVYWFEERETEELRVQRKRRGYRDPQLAAVRRAIKEATGLTDLSYRTIPPRGLTVRKEGVELRVDQLSTGERVFVAMAGDLARRLAMLSGGRTGRRNEAAIVLIDEIELHLHARWQREILPWMLRAFARCQFIVTTHSPQVIGDIEARNIRVLEFLRRGNEVQTVLASKGRDSNFLLLNVFGADERSAEIKGALGKFEQALKNDDFPKAAMELEQLETQIEGSAPELSIAQARLERRRASAS